MKANSKIKASLVFLASFAYYILLSAKQYTWLFASGDSGDWLAASNWWIVPQPFGSPLYITLGHFLNLFPGDLVIKMTILLSCLPAAITVMLVYLIVKHLTNKTHIALTASVVLLGASIFLTQATVLEQYSLAVMFVTLAYYFYLKDKKWLVALSLGLGSANHIIVIPTALLWLLLEREHWRDWLKVLPVYFVSGILPYGLIIYLMSTDAPRLLAGGLSWQAINSYLGSTNVVGSLSITALPGRALDFVALVIMSFGLAVIPIWLAFKKPWSSHIKLLIVAIIFPMWYYLTCLDPTTWTFTTYACPFVAIATGIGLTKVSRQYITKAIATSAIVLIVINSIFLNTEFLARAEPKATEYYQSIEQLPNGSALVMNRGGFEALDMFYALSEGKDIIPIFFNPREPDALWNYYVEWLYEKYGIEGSSTKEQVQCLLEKGISTYVIKIQAVYGEKETLVYARWHPVFQTVKTDNQHFDLITGVNEQNEE